MSTSISFPIPAPGIWTITGQFAGQTVTQQINITDKDSTTPVVLTFSFSTITVTSPVGTALLLTDGTNQLTAVSTGTNTFTIYNMGQWTVSGTLEGYTLNSVTVNVAAGQDYPVQLSIQTATLTVTAPAGTVVSVIGNGDTQEITATSGTAVFQLTGFGSYQVSGVLNGLTTNTVTVDVTAYQAYTATLTIEAATIVVTTLDDVLVTAQNGNITLTDTAVNGQVAFQTQTFGTWTIGGTLTGYTFAPQTVNVQAYQQYDMSLEPLVATITVTAPNGTEVTAENSTGEQVQGYVSNRNAVLNLYSLDTWTVSGVQNGLVTNTVPVQVTDWTNYPVTLTIWAATITVTTPTGTLVTAQNGATQVQGTASNDQVILAVQLTGDWLVSAQFDDQTDSETVNVQTEENYPIRLWVPTIVPTVVTGSVVTCTQGDTVLTKTSQSGKVKFYVPTLGEWTLNATLNQQSSNTVIVDVQEDRDYPLMLSYTFATITVSTVAGTEITAQNGNIIITQTADSNGEAVFEVATFGTWTVSATLDGEFVTELVEVSQALNYDVELKSSFTQVVYFSDAANLSVSKSLAGTASFPTVALIAGGEGPDTQYPDKRNSSVNAYDTSLTRTILTPLQERKSDFGGGVLGEYAIFPGGIINPASQPAYTASTNTVDIYNSQLTMFVGDALPKPFGSNGIVVIGPYAILHWKNVSYSSMVIFNSQLTMSEFQPVSEAFSYCYATELNDFGIFTNFQTRATSLLDQNLTETPLDPISLSRPYICATHNETYALFGGGGDSPLTYTAEVDAYNTDFTHTLATELSAARAFISGASFGQHAVFAGGRTSNGFFNTIDSYNKALTRSNPSGMSPAKLNAASVVCGPYLLIAGGSTGYAPYRSTYYSNVNVFTTV